MIRWKQAVDHFPDFGLTFGNPDFVKYAESYGAKGSRVESTASLIPTLENAFKGGGVHLVVVPIDYSENTRVLVDELREKLKQVVEPNARAIVAQPRLKSPKSQTPEMESAMSEQINEQAEKMREMAQTTLDKAKEAVSNYMTESQKLRDKADSGVRATYSTAKEMNDKAVAFAEANVAAGFEPAQRLLHAKNPPGMGAVYQSHLKEQM